MSLLDNATRDSAYYMRTHYPTAARPPSYFGENFAAGWDRMQATFRVGAMDARVSRLIQDDITAYENLTGRPYNPTPEELMPFTVGERFLDFNTMYRLDLQNRVGQLPPEQQEQFNFDYEGRAGAEMEQIVERQAEVGAAATGGGRLGAVLGGLAGGAWDPTLLVISALGGAALIGRAVGAGRAIAFETALGAALEATFTREFARQERAAGQEFTVGDAILNITLAGVGSGAFAGLIRGAGAGARAIFPSINNRTAARAFANALRGTEFADPTARMVMDTLARQLDEASILQLSARAEDPSVALRFYQALDEATESVLSGRMIDPTPMNFPIDYDIVVPEMNARVAAAAAAIDDPSLRADFVAAHKVNQAALFAEIRRAEEVIEAAARSPAAKAAVEQLRAIDTRLAQLSANVKALEDLLENIDAPTTNRDLLELYAPDPAAVARLRDKEDLAAIDDLRPQLEEAISADLAAAQRQFDETLAERPPAIGAIRRAPGLRRPRDPEIRALLQKVSSRYLIEKSGRTRVPVDGPQVDETPWKTIVSAIKDDLAEAVEPKRVAEVQLLRKVGIREMLEASQDKTTLKLAELIETLWKGGLSSREIIARVRETLPELEEETILPVIDMVKSGIIRREYNIVDESGARTFTNETLLRELDEDALTLKEFEACRGVTSG